MSIPNLLNMFLGTRCMLFALTLVQQFLHVRVDGIIIYPWVIYQLFIPSRRADRRLSPLIEGILWYVYH